jgi:hypothetical protein
MGVQIHKISSAFTRNIVWDILFTMKLLENSLSMVTRTWAGWMENLGSIPEKGTVFSPQKFPDRL